MAKLKLKNEEENSLDITTNIDKEGDVGITATLPSGRSINLGYFSQGVLNRYYLAEIDVNDLEPYLNIIDGKIEVGGLR